MTNQKLAAGITGLGFYVPERVLTNDDLEHIGLDTNDEWIRSRTGIGERHIAADNESTADLAEHASRQALEKAGVAAENVQLVIVATCTPDYQFPSTASLLQHRLGISGGAFDLGAACSGFVYALVTAQQFIESGTYDTVLVVGAEVMTRILDWTDRTTCVLFGDGAGAAVVQRVDSALGMRGFDLGSDGSKGDLLKVAIAGEPNLRPAGGDMTFAPLHNTPMQNAAVSDDNVESAALETGLVTPVTCAICGDAGSESRRTIFQNGREVYRFAVNVMGESAIRALERSELNTTDVDLLVPHQANIRIIDAAARRLELPSEQVFVNVERYGNTSAASIPIALAEAQEQGRLKQGDTVVTVGFGGGLTWASSVMKWAI